MHNFWGGGKSISSAPVLNWCLFYRPHRVKNNKMCTQKVKTDETPQHIFHGVLTTLQTRRPKGVWNFKQSPNKEDNCFDMKITILNQLQNWNFPTKPAKNINETHLEELLWNAPCHGRWVFQRFRNRPFVFCFTQPQPRCVSPPFTNNLFLILAVVDLQFDVAYLGQ